MNKTYFHFTQDKAIKHYYVFLLLLSLILFLAAMLLCNKLTSSAKTMLLSHDEKIASSLIDQGVSEIVIAKALTSETTLSSQEGFELLQKIGIRPALDIQFLPQLQNFQKNAVCFALAIVLPICLLLLRKSFLFFYNRETLYYHASSIIENYIDGNYTYRLPQSDDGAVYHMFSVVDRLATMLQAQNETEQKSKIFLKNTISDISHQLKTPLAALSMYQEIIENEPENPVIVQQFAAKTALALKRMEQLIQSLLKITRLDTGNVVFEKETCNLFSLISHAVSELTTRAANEDKTIILDGSNTDTLFCDAAWTSEAISNIVKNALDHMGANGTVRISWSVSHYTGIIQISDNGSGIASEDIHYIFKRFYRSSNATNTQGIGLGLPLAKSIVEGQNGTISLQSTLHVGTTFTIMLPS